VEKEMINNVCEEILSPRINSEEIEKVQEQILNSDINLPSWLRNLKCPYCNEVMGVTSIRSIILKLNPRNIGDLAVEFLCLKCKVGNTLYFRQEAKTKQSFIDLLNDTRKPSLDPII
jgi:phage FluMu protein Com